MRSSIVLALVRKAAPSSRRHGNLRVGTLRKIYGHLFAAGQPPDTTLYELLELPGSHNLSDLHLATLQQDYDDADLKRKGQEGYLPEVTGFEQRRRSCCFSSDRNPASAHAQLVEQDVFTTASYDVECTLARSGVPELSCDRFVVKGTFFSFLVPRGMTESPGPFHPLRDAVRPKKVLEPGMTWSRGPFVCRYVRNELTCEREQHGFRIGRKVVVA